ncbi:hypothetical protein CASFOL_011177 [Castilleja foliolosa]|uniref:Uncharacterized protein n=1 Tax=Castilleja foliolosa TaxID=1961234 RepID=A0ABD3DWK9_9LAMI
MKSNTVSNTVSPGIQLPGDWRVSIIVNKGARRLIDHHQHTRSSSASWISWPTFSIYTINRNCS